MLTPLPRPIIIPAPLSTCQSCTGVGSIRYTVQGRDLDGQLQAPELGPESDRCDACKGTGFEPCINCHQPATTNRSGEKTCERHAEHCYRCDRKLDEDGECIPCKAKLYFGSREPLPSVGCSQCGGTFGGTFDVTHGFSSCDSHRGVQQSRG